MSEDKPRRIRAPYHSSIGLKFSDREVKGVSSRDISMSGVFIKSAEKFKIGEECLLTIELSPQDPNLTLSIKSKIARVCKDGVGLTFLEMDSDSFIHLRNIIKLNVSNPENFSEQCNKRPGFKD